MGKEIIMDEISKKIQDNLGLVYMTIKQYFPHCYYDDDIIQVGIIALWKAINKFNESKGCSFSSFAVKIIRNSIITHLKTKEFRHNITLVSYEECINNNSKETKILSIPDNKIYQTLLNKEIDINKIDFTPVQKKIIELLMLGFNQTEVANMVNKSKQSINIQIKKIRRKLTEEYDGVGR